MEKLIEKFKHLVNDQIGDGIYIAFEWAYNGDTRKLCRIYIGSKTCGPILQWFKPSITPDETESTTIAMLGKEATINAWDLYDGKNKVYFKYGAWTTLYSRGDFGKNYAYGGHWSGQTKSLLSSVGQGVWKADDKVTNTLTINNQPVELPDGIKGDSQLIDMDCSGAWTIFYKTAKEALSARISYEQIKLSCLPDITKKHLQKNETQDMLDRVKEVMEIYNL